MSWYKKYDYGNNILKYSEYYKTCILYIYT